MPLNHRAKLLILGFLVAVVLAAILSYWFFFVKPRSWGSCIQVITEARNPLTGQAKTFPTICHVPAGWDVISPKVISPSADSGIPPGYSSELIEVKFRQGADVDQPEQLLPPNLREAVMVIDPLYDLSEEELERINPNLKLWFRILLEPGTDALQFLGELRRLDSVEIAEPAPLPPPLP